MINEASKRSEGMGDPGREFDGMASAHAKDSGYPWKRSSRGTVGTGTSWSLTTDDAVNAPQRETLFSVDLDEETGAVLMAASNPCPPMEGLFDYVMTCPFIFKAYRSADEAMSACEMAFDQALREE